MRNERRKTAIFLLCCVVFVTLFSSLLTASVLAHECEIEECPFCCAISVAEKTISEMTSTSLFSLNFAPVFAVVFVLAACVVSFFADTLVTLKVKLSD